jgi:hypothetical protein
MIKRKPRESGWQAVLDIALVPGVARLPGSVRAERRDGAARHALLCRIHSEFEEMPGLSLSPAQAGKLFGLSPDVALRILEQLTTARVLCVGSDGRFGRSFEERGPAPRTSRLL